MAEYRSPSGEVLDIPAEGERAIAALGWVPTAPKETKAKPEKAPVKRSPKKNKN